MWIYNFNDSNSAECQTKSNQGKLQKKKEKKREKKGAAKNK